ncbi:MAG: uroporphyrinogen-III synthase [Zoogloeaceae bacterium]|jgi:uroporphyrinogen-III synthase|nr:uroporphyrinogen-III synthase [Zoogloeaceae bacterium]
MTQAALPLAGRRIVVTRPRAQADALAAGIRAQGGEAFLFPLLEIAPPENPAPLIEAARALAGYACAIFVSPNAARYALPVLLAQGAWPECVRAFAVGPGTAQVLQAAGIFTRAPSGGFDSEHLLALPELATEQVAGQQIALLRGNGGRELLRETLAARGATVTPIACYQRFGPHPDAPQTADFLKRLAAGQVAALTLSSSEALAYLLNLQQTVAFLDNLRALPLFAPHPRIAEKATSAGFRRVIRTAASDEGLLAGLCAYNWSPS